MADETESGQVKFENHALRYADGTAVEIGALFCCVEKRHPLENTWMSFLGYMRVDKEPDSAPEFHLSFRIEGTDGTPRRFDPAELPALEVVEKP